MTIRQCSSPAVTGEIPSCGCMPTGVEFRMASKYSVRKARRGTTSPPTARANCFAAFSRRAQTPTTAPARVNADAAFRNRLEKILESMNQEWEIDSVDLAREETRVVQQRRERVPDRIADHAVNMRSSCKLVSTIEILHLAEGDLTGGSCLSGRGV